MSFEDATVEQLKFILTLLEEDENHPSRNPSGFADIYNWAEKQSFPWSPEQVIAYLLRHKRW